MLVHLSYLQILEHTHDIRLRLMATDLGLHLPQFLKRGWVTEDGYLTHVMVPWLDSEMEVEAEIDETAQVWRYRSPCHPSRLIEQPLNKIRRYALQINTWLDDLGNLIGIETRKLSQRKTCVSNHLWHLGDARIGNTHNFAPIFVGRRWQHAPATEVSAALSDSIWPCSGVLLQHHAAVSTNLPREHVIRGLCDFHQAGEEAHGAFNAAAFDRVLRGFVTSDGTPEPEQFLQGRRVKLPHFEVSRVVSKQQAKILKIMWGEGKTPPAMKWSEVNQKLSSGHHSFDDAFGDKTTREEYLARVKRGHYQVRRQ